jgi:oligopeptide transport system permease protein
MLATVSFFLLRTLPGNPFQTKKLISQETQARMMHYYGLDRPLVEQYLTYLGNLLHGDFGYSLKYLNVSVNSVIAKCFPVSAALGLRALAISYPIGLLLGVLAAHNRRKPIDYLCIVIAVLVVSVPNFIMASLLQYVFSVKLGWFPAAQWKGAAYMVLPTLAMALVLLGGGRSMRASMLEVMSQDYIKTARAKGISNWHVILRHELKNAYLPLASGLGVELAGVMMGTFVIEQIFVIPGLGKYFATSVQALDYTMVMGLTIFYGSILVLANFGVDLLYGLLDPRIRIAK